MKYWLQFLFLNGIVLPFGFIWTLLFIFLSAPAYLFVKIFTKLTKPQAIRLFIWIYGRIWMRLTGLFIPIHTEDLSAEVIPKPCIFAVNHLSFFDVYCMGLQPHSDVCFVVRNWPFKIPIYAPFMYASEYLNSEKLSPEEFFHKASRILGEKACICFFPEGHRSKTGKMGRFHSGAFKLAVEVGVPIVPLCLTGTRRFLRPGGFVLRPSVIRMKALEGLDSRQYQDNELGHIELRKEVKRRMVSAVEAMRRQDQIEQ